MAKPAELWQSREHAMAVAARTPIGCVLARHVILYDASRQRDLSFKTECATRIVLAVHAPLPLHDAPDCPLRMWSVEFLVRNH